MENDLKNVSLSFCCKEDWNDFNRIDDKARFCGACQRKVVDFTNASQSDFNQLINSGQKVCGHFKRSQMSDSFLRMAAASLAIVAASTSMNCTEPENVEPPIQKQESSEMELMGIVVGAPIPPDSLRSGFTSFPIVVADAQNGEEPTRYNPLVPSTGNYKQK